MFSDESDDDLYGPSPGLGSDRDDSSDDEDNSMPQLQGIDSDMMMTTWNRNRIPTLMTTWPRCQYCSHKSGIHRTFALVVFSFPQMELDGAINLKLVTLDNLHVKILYEVHKEP
ncbi:hypothetical protein FQR65_LT17316 [Abscondita terminalis]|nr:hypothetical protein FQR65_LT17316 [Abscondita terminalis]